MDFAGRDRLTVPQVARTRGRLEGAGFCLPGWPASGGFPNPSATVVEMSSRAPPLPLTWFSRHRSAQRDQRSLSEFFILYSQKIFSAMRVHTLRGIYSRGT